MNAIARSKARERPALLAALLILSFALNLIPLHWGLPDADGWAVDEILPSMVTGERAWPQKYPPFHRFALRAAHAPVRLLGIAPAKAGEDWLPAYNALFTAGRALSVLMATATVYLVFRCGLLLFDRRTALLAGLITAVMPPFVYYAKTVNLEVPYVFWFALSLFFYLRALDGLRLVDFIGFATAAVLAIGTKDQAYGLFLFSPLVLLSLVYREHRSSNPPFRAIGTLIVDRRVLWATVSGVVFFLLIHDIPFNPGKFLDHLAVITGPGTFRYQLFESTFSDRLAMSGLALRHLTITLGLPLFLFALASIVVSLRRPSRNWRLLTLIGIGVTYIFGFVWVIGYHYVRFFLPLGILLSLFAAAGLSELLSTRRWRRTFSAAAVTVVMLFSLARAVAVDAAMLQDSRYDLEAWLNKLAPATNTLGVGNHRMMPRGLSTIQWGSLLSQPCLTLTELESEIILVNMDEERSQIEQAAFDRLVSGQLGFDETRRSPRSRPLALLRLDGALSNLNRISPRFIALTRSERPCITTDLLPSLLLEARKSPDPVLEEALLSAALDYPIPNKKVFASGRAAALGLHFDNWTKGDNPAAVAIENNGDEPLEPTLRLGCLAPQPALPLTVTVVDEMSRQTFVFDRREDRNVELAPLAPGRRRLVLLWSDKPWSTARDPRRLGVSVLDVDLREPG